MAEESESYLPRQDDQEVSGVAEEQHLEDAGLPVPRKLTPHAENQGSRGNRHRALRPRRDYGAGHARALGILSTEINKSKGGMHHQVT